MGCLLPHLKQKHYMSHPRASDHSLKLMSTDEVHLTILEDKGSSNLNKQYQPDRPELNNKKCYNSFPLSGLRNTNLKWLQMGLIQGKIKFGFTGTDITSHNISRNHFVMFYFVFTMTCLFKVASMEGDVKLLTRVKRGYGQGYGYGHRYEHHRCGYHHYVHHG